MAVTVHGVPGGRTAAVAEKYGAADARRGAFYEGVTGRALKKWLAGRRGDYHLFHDLTGLEAVSGHGYGPMGLGAGNIDHVILDAGVAVTIDAKGIGGGTLGVDGRGHGVLVHPDGSSVPQPWMDTRRNYSYVAVMYRLTGLPGHLVRFVPEAVDADERTLGRARCFADGGTLVTASQLEPGLGDLLCGRRAPADLVEHLAAYTAPVPPRELTVYRGARRPSWNYPRANGAGLRIPARSYRNHPSRPPTADRRRGVPADPDAPAVMPVFSLPDDLTPDPAAVLQQDLRLGVLRDGRA